MNSACFTFDESYVSSSGNRAVVVMAFGASLRAGFAITAIATRLLHNPLSLSFESYLLQVVHPKTSRSLTRRFVSFKGLIETGLERSACFHVGHTYDCRVWSSTGDVDIDTGTSASFESDPVSADQPEAELSGEEDRYIAAPKGQLQSGLYLVATPIGNLEDITLRALRVLKSADLILTEDTRHSAKLLQHYDIRTPTVSYHKFNETRRTKFALERLQHGGALALISDAGMPGISDPGAELVMTCVDAKIYVFPIPGPSAVIAALVAAGLRTTEFSFVGFLPAQGSQRRKRLTVASNETATQVLYVPPHKLCRVLEDCLATFGSSRRCVVAREMTKIHEEFWRGTLEEAIAEFSSHNPRGEITLVIEGFQPSDVRRPTDEELQLELETALASGISASEAAKLVAQKVSAKKKRVYELVLKLAGKAE